MATPKHVIALIEKAFKEKAGFLDLGNCGLTEIPKEIVRLAPYLKRLNLGDSYIIGEDSQNSVNQGSENILTNAADSLKYLCSLLNLTALDLSKVDFQEEFLAKLQCLPLMHSLNICCNYVSDKGANIISKFSHLNSLDISYNVISYKGAQAIAGLTQLNYLDVSGNEIWDKGAEAIAALSRLEYLYISNDEISDKGAEAISRLSRLKYLGISTNEISEKGAEAISRLSRLSFLDISNNEILDKGAEAISRLSRLDYLDIDNNEISDVGAEALAGLKRLDCLYISNNQISDRGLRTLIKNLPVLDYINFDGNDVEAVPNGLENNIDGLRTYFQSLEQAENVEVNNWIGQQPLHAIKPNYISNIELKGIKHEAATSESKKAKKIFLSYSHKDEQFKKELDTHFAALKRSGKVETWNDRKIEAGEDWDAVIKAALGEGDIFLLLLSPDFMASDYIWNIEIKAAKEKGATIVPIFLRPCDFEETQFEIYKTQGLPRDAKWITGNAFTSRDEGYLEVVKGIKALL